MAIVVLLILIAVTIAFFFTPGLALVGILPLLGAIAAGVWVVLNFAAKTTPAESVRRTPKQDLLGPGGPDDPDRR